MSENKSENKQLSQSNYESQTLVGFGKYKSLSIKQLKLEDSKYFEWCKSVMYDKPHRGYLFYDLVESKKKQDIEEEENLNTIMSAAEEAELELILDDDDEHTNTICILDTETTGFGSDGNKLVQLAYVIVDRKTWKVVKCADRVLKHFPIQQDYYKTLSIEEINKRGLSQYDLNKKVIYDFKKFDVKTVVAHNLDFDMGVLRRFTTIDFDKIREVCTMKETRQYSELKNRAGKQKKLKQSELYKQLFNKDVPTSVTQHNGLEDVKILYKICKRLRKKNMVVI
jgi:DNA polymerase III epsilon subunit-like protein